MRMTRIIWLPVILFATLRVNGQTTWTLRQCIDYAIENNVNIRQAVNTADQSGVDVSTAKWRRLPSLNASVGEGFNWGRSATRVQNADGSYSDSYINTSSNSTSFALRTSVPLFTGFEISNQYSLAKLNLEAAVADFDKAKEDLAVNITSAYLQVLFNKELSKIADEQVVLSKEQMERVVKLSEVGKSSPAEVAESKARVAQDEMSAVQAKNNYDLSLLELSQMMELPTPEGFVPADPDENPVFAPLTPPDEIFATASSSKPAILAAQYRLAGSEKSIRIAQSGHMPQLSFNASLSSGYYSSVDNRSFGQQLDDNFSKYLGFSLSIPIFNRFSTRNQVRKAKLQKTFYSLQLEDTKKALYKEIQQSWYNAVAADAKFKTSETAVDANQESFRLMKEKYENGKATAIEYNEARLNLMKALSDKLQAKYEYMFRTKILDFYKGVPIE